MVKWDRRALRAWPDRRQTFHNGCTLTSMIVFGGSIRSILKQRLITLYLGDVSVYHKRLGATCATGY